MPAEITANAFNAFVTPLMLAPGDPSGEMQVAEPWLVPLHRAG
jgi:hypothetical protein